MDVQVRPAEANPDVKLLLLSGRFDVVAAEAVSSTIMNALEQSGAGVIMDIGEVDYISSAWLRVALAARKKATAVVVVRVIVIVIHVGSRLGSGLRVGLGC